MNAILQSLLGLDCFANDLLHFKNIKQLPPKCLFLYVTVAGYLVDITILFIAWYICCWRGRGGIMCMMLRRLCWRISRGLFQLRPHDFLAIPSMYAMVICHHVMSCDLQDAHEFLAQCLDQLKEDCASISPVRCVVTCVIICSCL